MMWIIGGLIVVAFLLGELLIYGSKPDDNKYLH